MSYHLYFLCYRVEALIASMLEPAEFGSYLAVGKHNLTRGKVLFFEVDPTFENDWFDLRRARAECVPAPDGTPKHSVYVSIYRVFEHLEPSALGKLYMVTRDGRSLGLEKAPYEPTDEQGPFLYQELCPVCPLIASVLPPRRFGALVTDRSQPVNVPKILFADLVIGPDGTVPPSIPYSPPEHIVDCFRELRTGGGKPTKSVDRCHSDEFFYRTIDHGFFLSEGEDMTFYPFPSEKELSGPYHTWWRSASLG